MLKQFNKFLWKLIKGLGNLNFAIILLLGISFFSALGTIIEQEKDISFYEVNYPTIKPLFGFLTSNWILFFGLDHVYQTWWFITLILLFGSTLISCTFSRQLPSLKLAQLWQFYKKEDSLQKFELNFCAGNKSLSQLYLELYKRNYNILQQGPFLYAYKGLVGKVGPIIVHISIIIILIGSILGNLSGFMVQELVPIGGLFHLQNVISSGPFSYVPQEVEGYIHDFRITYSDEGSIDQFYSDLWILNSKGDRITTKTIYVNEPLRYKGIVFYQTDWGIVGLNAQIDNKFNIQVPLKLINTKDNTRFWIASLPTNGATQADTTLIILEDLTGKFQIYDGKQSLIAETDIGSKFTLNGHDVRITDIVTSTGLQIKSDPGIPFVYIGFLLLMWSVLLSYISYSQVWAIKKDNKLYLSGRTNRAIYAFEQEFINLLLVIDSGK
uniref:Cytochrome c biogenesis protein CcsB n=1 Tax=Chroomonas placoidea TaxID=173977 RepID=A0A222AI43_9CRYP|nr:c-type cytochrome biogenensis protein [Chroomonas placoidea]ASO76029.1 c-type cytochrome biogenensis protein [Chroomonas placoidea]